MRLIGESSTGWQFWMTSKPDGDATDFSTLRAALKLADDGRDWRSVARLSQVHSASLILVPPMPVAQEGFVNLGEGDALMAAAAEGVGAIFVADCAPVAIFARDLPMACLVHAGWRGLAQNIIQVAADQFRAAGAKSLAAVIGSHAGPCCYEFSPDDLRRVSELVGVDVAGRTRDNRASLDLYQGLSFQLGQAGVDLQSPRPACTMCQDGWFSYRRGDAKARQALLMLPAADAFGHPFPNSGALDTKAVL